MNNCDFLTVHNFCHCRPLLLLVPAVKRPSYGTLNCPSHNSVSIITHKPFIHVQTVALHKRPTCCNSTQLHSHYVSPAVTLTNSDPSAHTVQVLVASQQQIHFSIQ